MATFISFDSPRIKGGFSSNITTQAQRVFSSLSLLI
jgi:hypothetical protein